ncbi:PepSY-associated transmembrane protein [Maribacter caenipelagi]|uniref:PepSY-associated transmembrane protein n=1 Tax=Maribacter caenipelagi TaxID=1447781 RepID=A0A4R7CUD1_9FLAO|nr:PepSY domain-containing protein [Maribacter caenipelagi]TDS12043.1 PepSY-associated transmembrane protein [Maribacter caenipelagi]
MKMTTSLRMRIIHRYLGFFLAGIMAMYSISGIIMIFRNTDFLKHQEVSERQLEPNLTGGELSPKLRMAVKVDKKEGDVLYFKDGNYNTKTGMATITKMELPFILDKMEHLHKATTNSPVYWLNIMFGLSLLFFVISSFWMFMPKTTVFKKGLYFSLGGILLTIILLFV